MSVSIKDVDENAYRNLKAEAIRRDMKIGEAASEAFRLWISSKRQNRQRDVELMRKAAETMDRLRKESKTEWSGTEEIRKWRDQRKL
jgi:translation initiation factor 2B subunit (eIF-2B alpha/beta/delta family)